MIDNRRSWVLRNITLPRCSPANRGPHDDPNDEPAAPRVGSARSSREVRGDQASSSASRLRVLEKSSGMPGPFVVVIVALVM